MNALRQQRVLKGIAKLRETVKKSPSEWPALLTRMAELYVRGGMLIEARQVLDRVLARDPLDLKALLMMARVLMASEEPEKALGLARSIQESLPAMEEAYRIEQECLEAMDRGEELILALRAYLGRFPERSQARIDLARWLEALGRPTSALEEYRNLLERGYRPAGVYERMGAIHRSQGDLGEALSCFGESERLAPGKARVREAIARGHYALGNYEEAKRAAAQLCAVKGEDAAAQRLLARAALASSDFETAAAAYEIVLEQQAGDTEVRREYAESLFFAGDVRAAASEYRQVLAARPTDGLAHFRLAEILASGYFLREAEVHYRAAQTLMPDSPAPLERLGELAMRDHRHHQAASHFLRWMMLEPANSAVHRRLGRVYRILGEVISARRHLTRAEELGDGSSGLLYERALLERAAGQNSAALRYLSRSMGAGPDGRERALIEHERAGIEREESLCEERTPHARPGPAATESWTKIA